LGAGRQQRHQGQEWNRRQVLQQQDRVAGFLALYGPMLIRPRIDGKPG
jgi:hypothetical protein